MRLTSTEQLAYKELQNRGYSIIEKTKRDKPDFICDGKDRYEIKMAIGKSLIFTAKQFKNFRDDDKILVYRDAQLIAEFLWKDKSTCGFRVLNEGHVINIPFEDDEMEKLKEIKGELSWHDFVMLLTKKKASK